MSCYTVWALIQPGLMYNMHVSTTDCWGTVWALRSIISCFRLWKEVPRRFLNQACNSLLNRPKNTHIQFLAPLKKLSEGNGDLVPEKVRNWGIWATGDHTQIPRSKWHELIVEGAKRTKCELRQRIVLRKASIRTANRSRTGRNWSL